MDVPRIQETVVQSALVTEQQKPLGIHIETPEWVNFLGKAEFRKSPLSRLIRRELAEDSVGFVECDDQGGGVTLKTGTVNSGSQ